MGQIRHNRRGRPRSKASAQAQAIIDDTLTVIDGAAEVNIRDAVTSGNLRASQWWLERRERQHGRRIKMAVDNAVADAEDVIQIGRQALIQALTGDISLEDLQHVQAALKAHVTLLTAMEIDELKAKVAALEQAQTINGYSNALPPNSMPRWGALQNAEDVEFLPEEDND
jgi:hypothetical protein